MSHTYPVNSPYTNSLHAIPLFLLSCALALSPLETHASDSSEAGKNINPYKDNNALQFLAFAHLTAIDNWDKIKSNLHSYKQEGYGARGGLLAIRFEADTDVVTRLIQAQRDFNPRFDDGAPRNPKEGMPKKFLKRFDSKVHVKSENTGSPTFTFDWWDAEDHHDGKYIFWLTILHEEYPYYHRVWALIKDLPNGRTLVFIKLSPDESRLDERKQLIETLNGKPATASERKTNE